MSPHPQRRRLPNSQALRAIAWRWRFVFLGLVAAFVLNSIMSTIGTKEQHTILVATRDIPAGTYVERSHITEVIVGDHLAGLASLPEQIVGHALIAPVEEGAPLPLSNIINEDFLSKPRDGYVITAVELADTGGLDILQVGSIIDVYAGPGEYSDESEARLIATNIRVAGIVTNRDQSAIFSDVADKKVFFLEIPDSAVSVFFGIGARTPLHAVLSAPGH